MPILSRLQKLQGKGDGEWRRKKRKKVSLHRFSAEQKIASSWEKQTKTKQTFWGVLYIARATSYCLLPDTFWLRAFKNAFKAGTENFANSLSPPSIVKKVRTGNKNSQGT